MKTTKIKSLQQCQDLARGACFLGVGGGGDPKIGLALLEADLKAGQEFNLVSPDDLPDDTWTCCAWGMGSIAPRDPAQTAESLKQLGIDQALQARSMAIAVRELQAYSGRRIDAIVPFEPGGRVTTSVLSTAADLGVPMTDGDYCGRAVPEVNQILPGMAGVDAWPAVAVDPYGSVTIIKSAASVAMVERIGKHLAMAAMGPVTMAGFLVPGKEARRLIIPHVATRSLHIGQEIRKARSNGNDPVDAASSSSNGKVVLRGKLTRRDWEDTGEYMTGTIYLEGTGAFQGDVARIWLKNENHLLWINDNLIACSPDLISVVDDADGEPIINPSPLLEPGRSVAVIVSPRPSQWSDPALARHLEPRWFGFDIDPLEPWNSREAE